MYSWISRATTSLAPVRQGSPPKSLLNPVVPEYIRKTPPANLPLAFRQGDYDTTLCQEHQLIPWRCKKQTTTRAAIETWLTIGFDSIVVSQTATGCKAPFLFSQDDRFSFFLAQAWNYSISCHPSAYPSQCSITSLDCGCSTMHLAVPEHHLYNRSVLTLLACRVLTNSSSKLSRDLDLRWTSVLPLTRPPPQIIPQYM